MNLALWLEQTARRTPSAVAIAQGTTPWCDYAGFVTRSQRCAAWLQRQGVGAGDRVVLFMANSPEYLPLIWGAWWLGAVVVPVNAKLHAREAAWIVGHSGAQLALCDTERGDALAQALRDAGTPAPVHTDTGFLHVDGMAAPAMAPRLDSDAAWLFYTSGTTGRPKGVTLGLRQLRWMTLGYLAQVQSVAPGDACLHPAPLSHGSGLYHLAYVLQGGVNVVPASGGFDAAETLALAAHWRNASFFAAPTIVRRLTDAVKAQGLRCEGLATITYGGGPMYLADIDEALQFIGPHFAQIYGQGESPMTITVLPRATINDTTQPRHRERLASVGQAFSMVEVCIRDAQGRSLPTGEMGDICVRGDVVMSGYWNDPVATAAAMDAEGWLLTGDMGRLDADGYLTLLDRSKDLVSSGGTNIYPREVEEALLTHPAVAEVAVIGRSDPEWGEVVVAFVVRSGAVDATELDAHCLDQIARFKRPKHYQFVSELPKNAYGKVLKTALRDLDRAALAG